MLDGEKRTERERQLGRCSMVVKYENHFSLLGGARRRRASRAEGRGQRAAGPTQTINVHCPN